MAQKLTVSTGAGSFTCDIFGDLEGAVAQYIKDGIDDIWCCDENEKKDDKGRVVEPPAHHCTKLSEVSTWTIKRLTDSPEPDPGRPGIPDHIKDKAPEGGVIQNG